MTLDIPSPSIWSSARRPRLEEVTRPASSLTSLVPASYNVSPDSPTSGDPRSDFQHDYDRLLFSTPVRRLADKTQVWPMDENDSVRTRLTHSHEVANLARSIGARVFQERRTDFEKTVIGVDGLVNVIQPVLLATGLGHDLGNPPFGHQGEAAIGRWFQRREGWIFSKTNPDGEGLNASQAVREELRSEFTMFDGNPQTLRLLTRLQTHIAGNGLDLTAATLAAGLKYPVCFADVDRKSAIKKKGGYFSAEKDVVDWVREQTGLREGQRHPLTWIMEACDDIAYSVLDVEDVLKKGVMSPDDVLIVLRRDVAEDPTVIKLLRLFPSIEERPLRPDAQRDIKIQYLRAFFIESLVTHASKQFTDNLSAIFDFSHAMPLMDSCNLCGALKRIARTYAFNNPLVLKTEALGAAALDGLMCAFWSAITDRKDIENIESRKLSARSSYIFSLISPNYVQQANPEETRGGGRPELRYRELRLLTDMVSGMTDTYAMRLWAEVRELPHADRSQ